MKRGPLRGFRWVANLFLVLKSVFLKHVFRWSSSSSKATVESRYCLNNMERNYSPKHDDLCYLQGPTMPNQIAAKLLPNRSFIAKVKSPRFPPCKHSYEYCLRPIEAVENELERALPSRRVFTGTFIWG